MEEKKEEEGEREEWEGPVKLFSYIREKKGEGKMGWRFCS